MKQILLFGAGKSATVLIDYLLANAGENNWKLIIVDANIELARTKINGSEYGEAAAFDIHDDAQRSRHINAADVVISMLPPALHFLVAKDCLQYAKHLFTASYVDAQIKGLAEKIKEKGLLFLCEMGLDPGIDHMSAMKLIDEIHAKGYHIISFKSHCGGLVAPESDNNPWHYKISWNPRNIVLAGKSGAHFRDNGEEIRLAYEELFSPERMVDIPGVGFLGWYPNRDSLSYTSLYGLEGARTFIRTTLRHTDFMYGWKNIIELKLTDEEQRYDTTGKSLAALFREHMEKNNFGEWLQQKMTERFKDTQDMLANLTKLMEAEEEAEQEGEEVPQSFLTADDKGNLEEIEIDDVKTKAAAYAAHKMHEANLTLKQLIYLGLDDNDTIVNKGLCSPADILQFAVEKKLALQPQDKDMIVMLHEFEFVAGHGQPETGQVKSSLVVKGDNSLHTAMAKTVGLPLGIAVKLLLKGELRLTGLHIPTVRDIYEPVLEELEKHGIKFREERTGLL